MVTGLEKDAIEQQHMAAIRNQLKGLGYDPDQTLSGYRIRVTDGRGLELVRPLGADPVSEVVQDVIRGRARPKKDYSKIRAEVESKYQTNEAQAAVQRKLGLAT